MRKLLWLLLAAAPLFAAYQPYQTMNADDKTDPSPRWRVNGSYVWWGSATGPTFVNGSWISTVPVPDGSADYDVRMTVTGLSSFAAYLRSTPDNTSYYSAEVVRPGSTTTITVNKVINGTYTVLASVPIANSLTLITLRASIVGNKIRVSNGNVFMLEVTDNDLVSGAPGIGGVMNYPDAVTSAEIGPADRAIPSPVDLQRVFHRTADTCVHLQWQTPPDDASGTGVQRIWLDRNGTQLVLAAANGASDCGLSPGTTYAYTLKSVDYHGNFSPPTTFSVTTNPAGAVDPHRIGVNTLGAYWGAESEHIDMRSGNLNFSAPLFQAIGRGGWGVTFGLNYNSQLWLKDSSRVWKLGADTGFGFGWRVLAGSIFPYWSSPGVIGRYIFSDATGAEHHLTQNNGNVWTSTDGTYVSFNANTSVLYFPDGSRWTMGTVSAGTEEDAGTLYPTLMSDVNINTIQISYQEAAGTTWTDSSSRITKITDIRGVTMGGVGTYVFTYETPNGEAPRLKTITNNIASGESFDFQYSTVNLHAPFSPFDAFGTAKTLTSLTSATGAHQFEYDSTGAGELQKVTLPLGGWLRYEYANFTYPSGTTLREVSARYLGTTPGSSTEQAYPINFGYTAVNGVHQSGSVTDVMASASKTWQFETTGSGLLTAYQEKDGSGAVVRQQSFAWAGGSTVNPYVSAVTTALENGLTSKTEQVVDAHGNLTQKKVYAYGSGAPGALLQTYNFSYLSDSQYTSRYIYNRLTSATVADERNDPNTGSKFAAIQLVQNTYDSSVSWYECSDVRDLGYHTSWPGEPGNVSRRLVPGSVQNIEYSRWGEACAVKDDSGHTLRNVMNFAGLPTAITPYTDSGLATNLQWNSFLGQTQQTGPNGAAMQISWSMIGRPFQTVSPNGAVTSYGYATRTWPYDYVATNGHWTNTRKDGLGRPVKVEKGYVQNYNSITVSVVDTEYTACACSPIGKVKRVSQPHAPGAATVYWTEYVYDALGRTLQVKHPNGTGITTYSYSGNTVTVSDPADKWKTFAMDALGNLTQVTEPRPGGGNYTTSYYYNPTGKLIRVEMPRDGATQVRTFVYDAATQRLTSATNPETGTVTYAYNADGTMKSKTDARGNRTENTYDDKQRVTMVQVFNAQNVEMEKDRKTYTWDVEDEYTQNGMGRVGYEAMGVNPSYLHRYSYTPAGLVTAKRLEFTGVPNAADMEGTYGYDNEGRMVGESAPDYRLIYEYDSMGRVSQMKRCEAACRLDPSQWPVVASASYGVAGEVLSLGYFGTNEARQYNERFQMTRQTVYGVMDMEYRYSATTNNGRIISQKDNVSGEEVAYNYDELNRLISAISSGWSQSYTYDGFGNKLTHTGMASLSYTNNQINGIHGWLYDLNGNATVMPWATLSYDGFNRAATATTSSGMETYGYAPDNKRVMRQRADGVYEFYFYNVRGERVTTFSNNQFTSNYYFLGRLVKAGNDTVVTDRLGSVRNKGGLNSRYYPYGEEQTVTASNREKFATYYRDQATNLDYADQRYYASGFGRFLTADPYGGSAQPGDPGSWNRYAYTLGDPVNRNDPEGLDSCTWENRDGVWTLTCPAPNNLATSAPSQGWVSMAWKALGGSVAAFDDTFGSDLAGQAEARRLANSYVRKAISLALKALENSDCQGLFGTDQSRASGWDPSTALQTAYSSTGGYIGGSNVYVGYKVLAGPFPLNGEASVGPAVFYSGSTVAAGFRVEINASNWNELGSITAANMGATYQAADLLHELGHIYAYTSAFGSGGSQIKFDGLPGQESVSQANAGQVLDRCFGIKQ